MNKNARIVLAVLFVFALLLMSAPLPAQAIESEINPLIAGGSWMGGTDVNVTTLAAKAPTWLQLLTNGVKVTEAGKICHPFRGGQFGWIGEIRQYKNGEWFKLKTTNDWVPNQEGEFMSCAEAPSAGTYALFGYWKRPAGFVEVPTSSCAYSTTDWDASFYGEGPYFLVAYLDNIPEFTSISYNFIDQPDDLIGPNSGTGTMGGSGSVNFSDEYIDDGWESVDVELSALGCSKIITIPNSNLD